jgi:hypothetical protein
MLVRIVDAQMIELVLFVGFPRFSIEGWELEGGFRHRIEYDVARVVVGLGDFLDVEAPDGSADEDGVVGTTLSSTTSTPSSKRKAGSRSWPSASILAWASCIPTSAAAIRSRST